MLHLLLFTSFVFVVFSSPLKVSLKPSWNDTPLFYETLSYVSNDASHHFYDFITSLTQSPIFSSTGEDAYNQLIKIASNYVDQSLLELSLSLRSESPFVAASDSLPVACESILYGNECGTVDEVINTTSQFNYPKYLLHLVGNISNQAIVVIPQPSLNLTLQKLLKHYQNGLIGGISLLLRPSLASGLKDGIFVGLDDMTLPGYDVEVMHRNFKKEFGLTRDKDDYMYLKEIDSAKIRAAVSTVLMNNSQKFIETLQSNVQYLPYSLVELSKVDNKRMYYSFSNQNEMADQIFAINRIPFDFATHSVYDFLTIIRNEQRLQQLLKSHNLPTSLISSSTPHLTQPLIRFEIPQQLMISINSFEHKMYGKFSKQLTSFFQYNPYRLFRFTAADLYTFVITASFSTDQNVDQTLTLLKSVETFMYRYMAVMKYSIFPIDKPTTEKGEILLAALLDIDKRWGYDGLMKFIDKIGDMEVFTVDRLKSCIYDVYREYGESFYNPKQIIDSSNNINNMVNYAQEHGFKTSCVFLNGIYMSIDNLYNEIGKVYGNDIKLLEGLIQKRSITEGNVYQQLHKHFVFFDYFDETLTKTTNQSLATGQNILSLKFNEKEKHIITLCNVNKEIQHLALSEAYKNNYYFYYGTKDINLSNSITELVRLGRIDKAKELLTSNDFIEDCSDDIVIFDSIKFNVSKHLSSQIEIIKMVHSPLHSYLQSQVSKNEIPYCQYLILNDQIKNTRINIPTLYNNAHVKQFSTKKQWNIFMMLDPITREAQKAASLLSLLEKIYPDGIDIDTVLIKTKGHGGEFPSEFMYSVYPSTVQFENGIRKDPVLVIDNLPKTLSFQMKILPPQPVDVLLTNTSIDIDNIVMKSLNNEQQEITFTVQGLVIEAKTNKELYIGDESSFHMLTVQGDNNVTVSGAVSKDLYYQAIVPPGIYSVKEIQSDEADFNYLGDDIPMLSFTFDVKQIHFNRKEKQQIKDNSSPFKSFQKLFERTEEVINIFTIAGGKDYERTVKILMYSVQKNTKSKIKFWLFEDFLSPKARIDLLDVAKALNIQLEYVRYHWPYNMFKQVTKTRIIWANKILFLDLMFSQNLKRIIFMDADQVTRADAKELWNYDLKNHAIAMTPFCTGSWMNKETEGYRFWYQESWKAALGKHPYHISALFIVDLNKFRKDNVGGFYRAMYNNLTPDPNNLANLDQDLPNYVQNKVPIFSLPQEWLWCESWCNEGVKAKAKTIDLVCFIQY